MNANYKKSTYTILTVLLAVALASCTNPSGPRMNLDEPSTGIDTNSATGLVADIPLEGEAILNHPDVTVADTVTWESGLSGNAMRGDEDGDFFTIADGALPELLTSGTVEVWIYPESPAGEDNKWAGILHKGEKTDFSDESWSIQYQGQEKAMFNYHWLNDSGQNKYKSVLADQKLPEGSWHHLAITWDYDETTESVDLEIYLNGTLNNSVTHSNVGPMLDSEGVLVVGSQLPEQYNASYGHLTFMGLIDEVAVYDHARSAEEINDAYQVYAGLL